MREQLDQLAEHKEAFLAHQSGAHKAMRPLVPTVPNDVRRRILSNTTADENAQVDGYRSPTFKAKLDDGHSMTQQLKSRHHHYLPFRYDPENYVSAKRKLKLAVFEYYKYLGYVKNYRLLNRTGFSKGTKKMEKVTRIKCQEAYMRKVHMAHFSNSTVIDDLQAQTETMFGASFEKGSRKKAIQRLRFMGTATTTHHFASWRAGVMLGAALPALIHGLVKGLFLFNKQ